VEAADGAGGARRGHLPGCRGTGSRRRWKAACSAVEDGVAGVCRGVVRGEGVAGYSRGPMACAATSLLASTEIGVDAGVRGKRRELMGLFWTGTDGSRCLPSRCERRRIRISRKGK
jgi:hypothetical protein